MKPVRIGITLGDPSGVGPEIVAKALASKDLIGDIEIVVIGDRWVFDKAKTQKSILRPGSASLTTSRSGSMAARTKLSTIEAVKFIDLKNVSRRNFKFGKISAEYGKAAMECLGKAVELIKKKELDCLVTAPISKQAINLAGYKYSGHTEFLAQAFKKKKQDLLMILLNKHLKTSLVTRHLALKDVSCALNQRRIYKAILETHQALQIYFAIAQPRICVAALNPHAGDGGVLGKEEIKFILPAVKKAKRVIKNLTGPLPADSAFSAAKDGCFDIVVAMYHDQALISLKLLDFVSGVNFTSGLEFVRTSPLHGTGFDIAGKNVASEISLITAINTAVKCSLNSVR